MSARAPAPSLPVALACSLLLAGLVAPAADGRVPAVEDGVSADATACAPPAAALPREPPSALLPAPASSATFELNAGQWDAEALYRFQAASYDAFLARDRLVLALDGAAVAMVFEGGGALAVTADDLDPYVTNYFLGSDPAGWVPSVPHYGRVTYREVYPGIDLALHAAPGGDLKYDFLVRPGASPDQVRLRFEGADAVAVRPDGQLAVETAAGTLLQAPPLSYQCRGGAAREVGNRYVVAPDGSVTFDASAYDPTRPLVVDPLVYSTFVGGTSSDRIYGAAVDSSGNAYIGGTVVSSNYPTTLGAYDATYAGDGNTYDAVVTKVAATGSSLVYSTYLGGSNGDEIDAITVDASGNAYVTGFTWSTNYPTTLGAFQPAKAGGTVDAFVTKLNPTGSALSYSTYLGGSAGSGDEMGLAIAVDASGNAYVGGDAQTTNFPVTSGAYQTSVADTIEDAFVTKLNALGTALVYSTYLGGSGGEFVSGIAVDGSGNAYVTGKTGSSNFPVTSGALQTTAGGSGDAFVTKLNAAGSALVYSTYLGGTGTNDAGYGIAVDGSGNAYVTGSTDSTSFPVTAGAFQTARGGGGSSTTDAFVTKLNGGGSALVYGTYLGGSGDEFGRDVALDASGNAYVAGYTASTNFPTSRPLQCANGGSTDAFVTKVNAAGSALDYSTYLGGTTADHAYGVAVDLAGNAYAAGWASSTNFPVTSGAYQTVNKRGGTYLSDGYVAKLSPPTTPSAPLSLTAAAGPGGGQIRLTWQAPASNGGTAITNYKVYRGATSGSETYLATVGNVLTYTDSGLGNGATYHYVVTAVNLVGEGPSSNEATATTFNVPTAPQGLQVTGGVRQVVLTWQAPASNGGSAVTSYKVYRDGALHATVGNVLTYTDAGLGNGVTYAYAVSAVNVAGEGAQSTQASGTTFSPPSAPQNLQATPAARQVTLTWQAPASNGGSAVTNYRIYRGTTPGGEVLVNTVGNVLTYTDLNLANAVTYYYQVAAVNAVDTGARSSEASATTPVVPPTAPRSLQASPGVKQISLTWQAPSDDGGGAITSYVVYRGETSASLTPYQTLGNVLSYVDAGLPDGATYYYKVAAVNSAGEGAKSSLASATTFSPPSAPQNLQASSDVLAGKVHLTWSAPASPGGTPILRYEVWRSFSAGSETFYANATGLAYDDAECPTGSTCYYVVRAVNAVGPGPFSNEAFALGTRV